MLYYQHFSGFCEVISISISVDTSLEAASLEVALTGIKTLDLNEGLLNISDLSILKGFPLLASASPSTRAQRVVSEGDKHKGVLSLR
jgi:hypothetical protein